MNSVELKGRWPSIDVSIASDARAEELQKKPMRTTDPWWKIFHLWKTWKRLKKLNQCLSKKWIILAVGFLFWEGLSRVFFRPCKIDCTIPVDLMLTIPASLPMSKRWLFFYPSELVKRWNGPPDTEKGEISLEVGSCTYGRSYPKTAWNTGKSRLLNIIINSCLNLQLGWCCCLKIKVMLCLFLGHHLLILKSIFVSTRKMSNLTCA